MRLVCECMRNGDDIDLTPLFRETNKRKKPQRAWSAQGELNQQIYVHAKMMARFLRPMKLLTYTGILV